MNNLPEKWYLKVTDENDEEIRAWRTIKRDTKLEEEYVLSAHGNFIGYAVRSYDLSYWKQFSYTEITTEQFRRYVLKKIKKVELIKGQWYEITSGPKDAITPGWYMKFLKKDPTTFRSEMIKVSEYISPNYGYKKIGEDLSDKKVIVSGSFSDGFTYTQVSIEDIKHHLPKDYVQEIVNDYLKF